MTSAGTTRTANGTGTGTGTTGGTEHGTGTTGGPERWVMLTAAVTAVTAVAGIAGAISYGHMHDWARANGEPPWRAMLFPLAVDGLLVAASVVLLADSRAGRRPDWLAYLLAATGAAVSVAANVAHDWTHPAAATAIAGWPPVALLGSYELLMRLLRRLRPPAAVPVPVSSPAQPAKTRTGTATGTRTGTGTRGTGTGGTPKRDTGARESRSAGQDKARAHWDTETAAGRTPTGAELSRIAGVDPSLGRRWRRDWLTTDLPTGTTADHPRSRTRVSDGRAA